MRVPDFFEPITAYRAWIARDNGLLCGRHQAEPWPVKRAMEARCTAGDRGHVSNKGAWKPAPIRGCSCGIYAYRTLEDARAEQGGGFFSGWNSRAGSLVFGAVRLWGRILEHERGYRAQFAYPSELITAQERLVHRLAIYGVPVRYEAPPPPLPVEDESEWMTYYYRSAPILPLRPLPSSVWWTRYPTSVFEESGPSVIWTPPEEQQSPLHVPDERARDARCVALWKEIANAKAR